MSGRKPKCIYLWTLFFRFRHPTPTKHDILENKFWLALKNPYILLLSFWNQKARLTSATWLSPVCWCLDETRLHASDKSNRLQLNTCEMVFIKAGLWFVPQRWKDKPLALLPKPHFENHWFTGMYYAVCVLMVYMWKMSKKVNSWREVAKCCICKCIYVFSNCLKALWI